MTVWVGSSPVTYALRAAAVVLLQGRGLSTHAYTHALETNHHMFMKLDNGKVRFGATTSKSLAI